MVVGLVYGVEGGGLGVGVFGVEGGGLVVSGRVVRGWVSPGGGGVDWVGGSCPLGG